MLRAKQRSDQARLLDDRDRPAALELCAADPVANVFVESRIRAFGLDPGRLGAQMWGFEQGGRLVSLCYGGANLVPVQATLARRRRVRRAGAAPGTALLVHRRPVGRGHRAVGTAPPVLGPGPRRALGPAADGRSTARRRWRRIPRSGGCARTRSTSCCPPPSPCSPRKSASRRSAATAARPTGPGWRSWSGSGRAFARIEDGQVIFKAEVGAATPQACQVQGVWVRPEYRGQRHRRPRHGRRGGPVPGVHLPRWCRCT